MLYAGDAAHSETHGAGETEGAQPGSPHAGRTEAAA